MTSSSDSSASDSAPPHRARSPGFVLSVVGIQAMVMLMSFGLMGSTLDENPLAPTLRPYAIVLAIGPLGFVLVVLGLLGKLGGLSLRDLGWRSDHPIRDMSAGIGGFVIAACLMLALLAARGTHPIEEVRGWLVASLAERTFWLVLGIMAVSTEESLFRGALQPALATKLGKWSALLVCAAVFSAYHFPHGVVPLVVRFLFGIVFGVLRLRTNSLIAPATTHLLIWLVIGSR